MNNGYQVTIDEDKCIRCGLCALECPSKTGNRNVIRSDQESPQCDGCLHCFAICPEHAVQIDGIAEERINATDTLSYSDLITLLRKRRSYRKFKETPVSEANTRRLADAARYTPTGGNAQDLSITMIRDQNRRNELEKEILKYYDQIVRLLKNPLVRLGLRFSPDPKVKATAKDPGFFERIEEIYERLKNGSRDIFYDAPLVMIFHTDRQLPTAYEDCVLAAYNCALAGETLGLGTCFVSLSQQAIAASKKIKKQIGIPAKDHIYAVLIAGIPAVKYRRLLPRREKHITMIN